MMLSITGIGLLALDPITLIIGGVLLLTSFLVPAFMGGGGKSTHNRIVEEPVQGPRLGDVLITASTYGKQFPHVYGTVRLEGNLIWTSGIDEVVKETTRSFIFVQRR